MVFHQCEPLYVPEDEMLYEIVFHSAGTNEGKFLNFLLNESKDQMVKSLDLTTGRSHHKWPCTVEAASIHFLEALCLECVEYSVTMENCWWDLSDLAEKSARQHVSDSELKYQTNLK